MSKFIYFTPEEKARAQNTDLVSLLRAQGERPIRSGREYRTPNDPSVTVRGNKWFDHSARVGGYAVSFVQRYYRLSYQEAVLLLLGRKDGKRYEQAQSAPTEPKPFALPDPYDNTERKSSMSPTPRPPSMSSDIFWTECWASPRSMSGCILPRHRTPASATTPRPTAGNTLPIASSTGSHTAATKNAWKPSGMPHLRPTPTWRNCQQTIGLPEMRTGWERQFRS